MQSVGAIYTHTNFVTLKYVTDAWGTDTNGFKLVITAVKDPSEYELYIHKPLRYSHFQRCREHSLKQRSRVSLLSIIIPSME